MPDSRSTQNYETFRGRDVTEALAYVRAAFGQDALIGGTRVVSNGQSGALGTSYVEVTAAPSPVRSAPKTVAARLFHESVLSTPGRPVAPSGGAPRTRSAARATLARNALRNVATSPLLQHVTIGNGPPEEMGGAMDSGITEELRAVRSLLEEIAGSRKPRERALSMLFAAGIEGSLATDLAGGLARTKRMDTDALRTALRAQIADRLSIGPCRLDHDEPRVIACIGPTGAGKTTTLAKMAARAQFEYGRNVSIVTLDTFRVGAVEQMRRFAELIGVPFTVAHDRASFLQASARKGTHLILVDTPSRAPTDTSALARLVECLGAVPDRAIDVLLTVPAYIRARDVERFGPWFSACPITGLVITKLDETDQAGGAMHAALPRSVPVVYLSAGPRVPEDLHAASIETVVDAVLPEHQRVA